MQRIAGTSLAHPLALTEVLISQATRPLSVTVRSASK
jgi:hypothetical protein